MSAAYPLQALRDLALHVQRLSSDGGDAGTAGIRAMLEQLGAVQFQCRQISPGADTPILVLHAHRPARFRW